MTARAPRMVQISGRHQGEVSLNALGRQVIEMALSEEQTDEKLKEEKAARVITNPGWRHADAAAQGKKYNYTTGG